MVDGVDGLLVDMSMMDAGKMVKEMDQVHIFINLVISMKEILKIIVKMDPVK